MALVYCDHEEVHTLEGSWFTTRCKKCPAMSRQWVGFGGWLPLPRYLVEVKADKEVK